MDVNQSLPNGGIQFEGSAPQPPYQMPVDPPKKSKRKLLIGVLLAIALLFVAPGIWLTLTQKSTAPAVSAVDSAPVEALATKASITQSDLDAIDKDNAFWAYFKNAALQSIISTTKEHYYTDNPDTRPTNTTFMRTGFDYSTKAIVQATEDSDTTLGGRMKFRCYNGTEFVFMPTSSSGWRELEPADRTHCDLKTESDAINDGMNTGGLNGDQAEAFIQTLRRQKGLFTITESKLLEKDGTQYIRFRATLNPVAYNDAAERIGNQWLMWGFKETGLDATTHPYAYMGAGGNGLNIVYVVDRTTKLPAYSEINTLPLQNKDGTDKPFTNYSRYRTQYTFGSMPDVSTANMQDIKLDW
jgi:hypothetical protein